MQRGTPRLGERPDGDGLASMLGREHHVICATSSTPVGGVDRVSARASGPHRIACEADG